MELKQTLWGKRGLLEGRGFLALPLIGIGIFKIDCTESWFFIKGNSLFINLKWNGEKSFKR